MDKNAQNSITFKNTKIEQISVDSLNNCSINIISNGEMVETINEQQKQLSEFKSVLEQAHRKIGDLEQIIEVLKRHNNNLIPNIDERPHTSITFDMRKAAKILSDNPYGLIIGRNKLMKCLRVLKYLDRKNLPYQTFIEYGYFKVIVTRCGSFFNEKAVLTQKGIQHVAKSVYEVIMDWNQMNVEKKVSNGDK